MATDAVVDTAGVKPPALKAPLPQIPLIPTGGVNLETAADLIR